MKMLFRLSLGASLFGALIVGGSYACPRMSARLGWNLTEWLEAQQRLEGERRRGESLQQQSEVIQQILEAKFEVTQGVGQGRLTLYEAAARFRDLSQPVIAAKRTLFRRLYQGQTDDERWCRQVISFVRGGISQQRHLGDVADRLEHELARDMVRGDLRLPD